MCGICGVYGPDRRDELDQRVRRMTQSIAHRGPDASGVYVADNIALGHRRLSILDLSPAGAQPMTLGPSMPTITYNGEVYNFGELRRELAALGESFRGRSDTEVVLNAYGRWGLRGLQRLEGIFSLAIWDPGPRRLVLMRDRLGVKPLFYAQVGASLVFGSEIKAVLAAGGVEHALDPQALAEYLWYGNAYEERTIYRGVRSLSPGHWLIVENGRMRVEPWWRLEEWIERAPAVRDLPDAVAQVKTAIDTAVKRQLVADVPVGIFLSGGIDSSALAAAAMSVQSDPLVSYSAGFDFDEDVNELPKARSVAIHLGLQHHELHVHASRLEDVLTALVGAHDEPFADPANIPLYLLAHELGGAAKVVLQGDGGDEMFAGYRRYSILQYAAWLRLWPRLLSPAVRALGLLGARAARMLDAASVRDPGERMALLLTVETLAEPPVALLQPEARRALESVADPFAAYRRCAVRFQRFDPVQQMLLTDISLQLPSQFLPKVDRATMASGMEARVPLLDEAVASLVVNMPATWKTDGRRSKIVLRAALRDRLPEAILAARKTGFSVPYERWLRGALRSFARDAILDVGFARKFGIDRSAVERSFEEHERGRRERGFILWKLLQLALWSREYPMAAAW